MSYDERVERVVNKLKAQGLDGCVVSNPHNIRYLCGFTAGEDGWLFIGANARAVLTDGRYWAQVAQQCPEAELIQYRSHEDGDWAHCLASWLKSKSWRGRLGFEGAVLTFDAYASMREALVGQGGPATELVSLGASLDEVRIIKDAAEIDLIREAAAVADRAWAATVKEFKAGMRESEFSNLLEWNMKREGASKTSFDTIVASGPNGAYPHAGVTERRMQEGELITVDFGAVYKGYCSDITRTIWLGELVGKQREIFECVKRAHDTALQAVRPGLKGCEVDKIARDIIEAAGYGEAFNHSLGHGVGLAVHEAPGLRRESQTVLEAGMLVTIEPGIYLPGVGGCRVEDLVVITKDGCEVLSRAPYQLVGTTNP